MCCRTANGHALMQHRNMIKTLSDLVGSVFLWCFALIKSALEKHVEGIFEVMWYTVESNSFEMNYDSSERKNEIGFFEIE